MSGQFCPVAKPMELLDERWTVLVVRELLDGSVSIDGPREVARAVPAWIGQSSLAAVPRPA